LALQLRARSKLVVSFGDCAVSANVPELLERVLPLHEVIAVDYFLPGCPPSAARIQAFLEVLLRGEPPVMEGPAMLGFG
jgi:NAD-reducing hydrogenase small subunit